MEEEMIQYLLDQANLVDYTNVTLEIDQGEFTESCEDIPKRLIKKCKRLQSIMEEFMETDIPTAMAYDLWIIHSRESFCAGFTNIEGVSDDVLLANLLGVLEAINRGDI